MATFAKKKKAAIRKRRHSSSSSDESENEEVGSKLKDLKELQKARSRPKGVDIMTLAAAASQPKDKKTKDTDDPFKMKTGGFVDMKELKKKPINVNGEEGIGTVFAAETNRRDEDAEMLKYVEEELAKRKGQNKDADKNKKQSAAADSLFALPENLKVQSSHKRSEDMLSNQMLSGIPEIDLGIEAKIQNIEATENAKQKLLDERKKKKEKDVSDFVPTNMAANFMQHNRFNIEDHAPILKKEEVQKPEPLRVGDVERLQTPLEGGKGKSNDKSSDDAMFEKFKKQMRRF